MKRTLISPAPGISAGCGSRSPAPPRAAAPPPRRWPAGWTSRPTAADQLVLAVTEAASNLHKHASQGSMLLRITRAGDSAGDRDGDHRRRTRPARRGRGDARRPFHQRHPRHRARRDPPAGRLLRPVLGTRPRHRAGGAVLARAPLRHGLLRRAGPADRGGNRVRRRLRRGGVGRDADRRPVRRPRSRPTGRDRRQCGGARGARRPGRRVRPPRSRARTAGWATPAAAPSRWCR